MQKGDGTLRTVATLKNWPDKPFYIFFFRYQGGQSKGFLLLNMAQETMKIHFQQEFFHFSTPYVTKGTQKWPKMGNKAGCMANTSRGWVGRGGNMRFLTF